MDKPRASESDAVSHDKRRLNCTGFEQVGVIADLAKLHEDVHDREEVRVGQSIFCLIIIDILVV